MPFISRVFLGVFGVSCLKIHEYQALCPVVILLSVCAFAIARQAIAAFLKQVPWVAKPLKPVKR